jgi:large subunit ribosomal protein L4
MRVLAELVILPLTGAQLFQLPGTPVLTGQSASGTFRAAGGREVVPGAYADTLYQAPYYTTYENVNVDASSSLSYSPLGLMAFAMFSATGFAIGRSVASLSLASKSKQPIRLAPPTGVPVVNKAGESAGEAQLSLFTCKDPVNASHIVHRKLVLERRNMREGNAHTKTRGEVRGGGRKPYKQKGTGNARRGSTRSPLIVGGGVTFGPRTRNWRNKKMNRKEGRLAIALTLQNRAPSITVVKDLETAIESSPPKTKEAVTLLKSLGIGPSTHAKGKFEATSVVVSGEYEALKIAAKNIPYIKLVPANMLNVYDLLRPTKLIVSERALDSIKNQYGGGDKADDAEIVTEEIVTSLAMYGADDGDDAADDIIDEMEEINGDWSTAEGDAEERV